MASPVAVLPTSAGVREPSRSAASRVTGSRVEPTTSGCGEARSSLMVGSWAAASGGEAPSSAKSKPVVSTRYWWPADSQITSAWRSVTATVSSSGSETVTWTVRTAGIPSRRRARTSAFTVNRFWPDGMASAARISSLEVHVAPVIWVLWTENAEDAARP